MPAVLAPGLAITLTLAAQAPGDWKPLFNGKDLTGWTVAAGRAGTAATPAQWKVENGVLVGGQGTAAAASSRTSSTRTSSSSSTSCSPSTGRNARRN